MLSQGSVVKGRNAAKEVGSSREECCHRVQLYKGGMLSQGSVVQGRNSAIVEAGENADTAREQQSKRVMLIQRVKQHKYECCRRD
jgi:hypothetical protein